MLIYWPKKAGPEVELLDLLVLESHRLYMPRPVDDETKFGLGLLVKVRGFECRPSPQLSCVPI